MGLVRAALVLLAIDLMSPPASSFSITNIQSSDGMDINQPARSGQDAKDVELSCRLQLNERDHWTSCAWSHHFPDVWGLTNSVGYVMCSVSKLTGQEPCRDVGNLLLSSGMYEAENRWVEAYVGRLTHTVSDISCGLRISRPNANDTGIWRCQVTDNNPGMGAQSSVFWAETTLYVANKSEAIITEPRLETGREQSLWVDLSQGRGKIQSSCQSMYGVPPPELIWYIDEPRNKISTRDATITTRTSNSNSGTGSKVDTVISTISMDVDERRLDTYGVRAEKGYFSFSLGCYPNQRNYFTQTGTEIRNPAEVMVFGKNAGVVLTQSVLFVFIVNALLQGL